MKNDPCQKSLPPGVNKFFQKGPLRPEKSKKQKRASEEKSHKMKNDPCRKSLPPRVNKFFRKGPLRPEKSKKQKRASEALDKKSHRDLLCGNSVATLWLNKCVILSENITL